MGLFSRDRAREGAWKKVKPWDRECLALDASTLTLAVEGGGYWSGLIVPGVIVIVGLLTATVVLLVTREPAESSEPLAGSESSVIRDMTRDASPAPSEEPDEDE